MARYDPLNPSALFTPEPYRNWHSALALGILGGAAAYVAAACLSMPDGMGGQAWYTFATRLYPADLFSLAGVTSDTARAYQSWRAQVGWPAIWREALSAVSLVAGFAITTWIFAVEIDPVRHVSGRQYSKGKDAIKYALGAFGRECASSGTGLRIHPLHKLFLSVGREARSILIMGSIGGGKTQILWRLLLPIFARGDKALIFDLTKGDYTASVPRINTLIAPWDKRGDAWDIASDLQNIHDARSFAASMIPEPQKDKFWAQSAQAILVACIAHLIDTKGQAWGWGDLGEVLFGTDEQRLLEIAERHYPPAAAMIAGGGNTSTSIMINLQAHLQDIYILCRIWAQDPPAGRWSASQWLDDANQTDKIVVIQGNQRYAGLSAGLARAVVNFLASSIVSLEFAESKKRKIWFVLDELPQAGRLDSLSKLLEIGRSKGVRLIIAFQDVSQLWTIFDRETIQSWLSMIGTKIFGRILGAESQRWVIEQAGAREVAIEKISITSSGSTPSSNSSLERVSDYPVLRLTDLEALGDHKHGIRGLMMGAGPDICEIDWPFYDVPIRRKQHIPAPWWDPQPFAFDAATTQVITAQNQGQDSAGGDDGVASIRGGATPPLVPTLPPLDPALGDDSPAGENSDHSLLPSPVSDLPPPENDAELMDFLTGEIKDAAVDQIETILDVHGIGTALQVAEIAEQVLSGGPDIVGSDMPSIMDARREKKRKPRMYGPKNRETERDSG